MESVSPASWSERQMCSHPFLKVVSPISQGGLADAGSNDEPKTALSKRGNT
jgi:hypothetical protein